MRRQTSLIEELQRLRRYALLTAGDEQSADRHVERALKRLLASSASIPVNDLRFRLFQAIHDDAFLGAAEEGQCLEGIAPRPALGRVGKSLGFLSGLERQVFLLKTVERFPSRDISRMLDLDEDFVDVAAEEARARISKLLMLSVLIVEDEMIFAHHLKTMIEDFGGSVCGTASSRDEALSLAHSKQPSLVLADIQLNDGEQSGIDTVRALRSDIGCSAIFVTAFPERVIQSDLDQPTLILGKPVTRPVLWSAIRLSSAGDQGIYAHA